MFNSQSQRDIENGKVQATKIRSPYKRKWLLDNLMTTLSIIQNIWLWHQYQKNLNFCLFWHCLGHFTKLLRSNVCYKDDSVKPQRVHFTKYTAQQLSIKHHLCCQWLLWSSATGWGALLKWMDFSTEPHSALGLYMLLNWDLDGKAQHLKTKVRRTLRRWIGEHDYFLKELGGRKE